MPTMMTAIPVSISSPCLVKIDAEWNQKSGIAEPTAVAVPRAIAKFRAIPSASTPNPKQIAAIPYPAPKRITRRSAWRTSAVWYVAKRCGTVTRATLQGSTNIANTAHSAHTFSHFQRFMKRVGVAKLPLSMPAPRASIAALEDPTRRVANGMVALAALLDANERFVVRLMHLCQSWLDEIIFWSVR